MFGVTGIVRDETVDPLLAPDNDGMEDIVVEVEIELPFDSSEPCRCIGEEPAVCVFGCVSSMRVISEKPSDHRVCSETRKVR